MEDKIIKSLDDLTKSVESNIKNLHNFNEYEFTIKLNSISEIIKQKIKEIEDGKISPENIKIITKKCARSLAALDQMDAILRDAKFRKK